MWETNLDVCPQLTDKRGRGGKIKDLYFAFGEHDAMLITEMPDSVSAAAIALAFAAGGALRTCRTTALMSTAEGLGLAQSRNLRLQAGHGSIPRRCCAPVIGKIREGPQFKAQHLPSRSDPLRARWMCALSPDFAGRQ